MVTDLGDQDFDDDHILTMVTGALDVPKKWPMTTVIGFESCLAPAEYDYDSCKTRCETRTRTDQVAEVGLLRPHGGEPAVKVALELPKDLWQRR